MRWEYETHGCFKRDEERLILCMSESSRANEKDLSIDNQEVLARVHENDVPSTWRIFRISQKKLIVLITGFCTAVSLIMGFLALYIFGNYDHHPPVPPDSLHAIIIILLVFILITLLLSIATWVTMKNVVLVLTPEGLIRGDCKRPKKALYIHYQNVTEMHVNGSVVMVALRRNTWWQKQVDCRLFDSPPKEVAFTLIAAYEDFKARNAQRHKRKKH